MRRTTQVPNALFDHLLPQLTLAELRLVLIIIRQTNGWIDIRTGKRKTRDRISSSQFVSKSGLSRQTVSATLSTLCTKGIITITGSKHEPLSRPEDRKGKTHLFYAFTTYEDVKSLNTTCKVSKGKGVGLPVHNKTKKTKENKTKGFQSITSLLSRWYRR